MRDASEIASTLQDREADWDPFSETHATTAVCVTSEDGEPGKLHEDMYTAVSPRSLELQAGSFAVADLWQTSVLSQTG